MKSASFFLLAVSALGLAACKPAKHDVAAGASARTPQRVEVVTLARDDLRETLEVTGSLEANESIAIQPELAGLVREIAFEEGQVVAKGALLARLDDAELRAQVEEAEARADLARINRERADALVADRTLAQAEVDRVRSEERAAQAALELLRVRLARTRIVAPTAGVLGARRLSVGDYATPASVLTTLDDLSALKVTFRVPERSIPQVKPGTRVTARVRIGADEKPVETQGEVFFVSASIDPAVRASEVKAVLRDPPAALRPGMFASVKILLSTREQVLVAPEAALLMGVRGVQVIAVGALDGKPVARYVKVETGLRAGPRVEIRPVAPDTLEAGERIVASGAGALVLFPGAPLDPVAAFVEMKPLGSDRP
jgi:membrane fusion protein (multidrug efflux system)